MKAEELRIGNWIEWDDDSHEQVQVKSISYITDNETKEITNYFFNGGLSLDFLPIPLTEEWLIKFGFDKLWHLNHFEYVLRIDGPMNGELNVRLKDNDFLYEFWLSLDDCYEFGYGEPELKTFNFNITQVHQLQNLYFSLTGTELTIKP